MRVLLINPPSDAKKIWGWLHLGGGHSVPLGIAMLAACAEKLGNDVTIRDCSAVGETLEQFEAWVSSRDFDIVGITAMTPTVINACRTAAVCRKHLPAAWIVIGGPHPTALGEQTLLENPQIDIAAIGEGEHTWTQLLEVWPNQTKLDTVDGIAFRSDGKIITTAPRKAISDLDSLPLPAYHMFDMNRYRPPITKFKYLPCFSIIASRGCPHKCSYCGSLIHGKALRLRSPENILSEIKLLVKNFGCRELVFQDSSLCQNRQWLLRLCDAIEDAKLGLKWACLARVEQVDGELAKRMKKAGCWQISYGIESANQKSLDFLNKAATVAQARDAVKAAHDAGIEVRATYMLAIPGETLEDCKNTIQFARKLAALYSAFLITVPFPGTGLYELAKAEGIVENRTWDDFNLFSPKVFFASKDIDPALLGKMCRRAWLKYYLLTPKVILKQICHVPRQLLSMAGIFLHNLKAKRTQP